jgi:uncharacterized protein YigA (DUF484 family)
MAITSNKKAAALDPSQVADFLSNNPEFFEDRDALLLSMSLPHQQGGAVSLVEKQVALLRERNLETKKRLDEFVRAAKDNDAIFVRCQRLILSLLDAKTADEFFKALENSFQNDFKCSAYSLIAFDNKAKQLNHFTSVVPESSAREYVSALMKSSKPTLGPLRPTEQDFLFRHQSEKVKSAAVISILRDREPIALLAIGSKDPGYFQHNMGTLFIGFIADCLSKLLPEYVDLKPKV